jgi:hypothetical protein
MESIPNGHDSSKGGQRVIPNDSLEDDSFDRDDEVQLQEQEYYQHQDKGQQHLLV